MTGAVLSDKAWRRGIDQALFGPRSGMYCVDDSALCWDRDFLARQTTVVLGAVRGKTFSLDRLDLPTGDRTYRITVADDNRILVVIGKNNDVGVWNEELPPSSVRRFIRRQ